VNASIGVGAVAFAGLIPAAAMPSAWWTWWIANTTGVILVAPTIIAWTRKPRWLRNPRIAVWGLLLQALVIVLSAGIFLVPLDRTWVLPATFAIIPLVVWSSYSFGPLGATASATIFAIIAVLSTARGLGPFVSVSLDKSLVLSQLCIGIVTTTGLAMSAASVHRRALEKSAHELTADLTRAGRVSLTNELAAGVAHEVHQPLGVISNYAQSCMIRLRSHDPDTSALLEALGRIISETARAADAVRGIRRLLDQAPPREEPIEINSLARDAVAVVLASHESHRVTIRTYLEDNLPIVWGDATQVMQVMTNLLVNAVDACSEDETPSPFVAVHTARFHDGLAITVSDNGRGMDEQAVAKCFDRFVTTKAGGLGMGLAICLTIVERHGGKLTVNSAPGLGTTLRFTLAAHPLSLNSRG
jgi:signal transduction histidine kinase